MTDTSSPHAVLGLPDDASPDAIRKAYRSLALRYHPDRNPGDAAAADAFHAVREAYEAIAPTDPDAGYDAERVAREMQAAAAEAARRRAGPTDTGRGWQLVHVALDRPEGLLRRVGQSPVGRCGAGMLGLGAVVGVTAGALGLGWMGAVAGAAAAVGLGLLCWASRAADETANAVETHWQGLRDLRWEVLLGWSEIRAVRETVAALDLKLTEAAAARLAGSVPVEAFAAPGVYRLPLRESARLAAIVRRQIDRGCGSIDR